MFLILGWGLGELVEGGGGFVLEVGGGVEARGGDARRLLIEFVFEVGDFFVLALELRLHVEFEGAEGADHRF